MAVPYESNPITGLEVFDPVALEAKMRRFGAAGLSSLHAVFDFDFTLTMPATENGDRPLSSWSILERHLPPDAQKACYDLFDHYYPLEHNGMMTLEDAEHWWQQALTIQRDSRINLFEVEQHFLEVANIRPGSSETFGFLRQVDVPSVILSAGVKNVIDLWCAAYGVQPDLVVSTVFETDEDGHMTGWDESTVVHTFNKAETGHPELEQLKCERPNVIVVGDNLNDADMADGDDNVIRVRVINTHPHTLHDRQTIHEDTAKRFDALIEGDDLQPVLALAHRIDAYADAAEI